ncbi:MAG: hypothetical protein FWD93_04940 [Coriobacteriia bacterium]|nr:hypothetical protein [Coriobacteriia bacterium]
MQRLIKFLDNLEESGIFYRLSKIRDSVMVEVAVPGQRWEIEFMINGAIEIEKFVSDGKIFEEGELNTLFDEYSDK